MTTKAKCNYVTIKRLKQRLELTQNKIDSLQKVKECYEKDIKKLTHELTLEGIVI